MAEIGTVSSAIAVTAVAIIGGLNSIAVGILNAARWRLSVAMLTSADSLIRLLAISLVIQQDHAIDLSMVLWIQAAAGAACAVIALGQWRRLSLKLSMIDNSSGLTMKPEKWRTQLRGYGRPLSLLGFITFAYHISDRWAINSFVGTESVGLFAALYQIGFLPLSLISALALNLFTPILFDAAESANNGTGDRGLRLNLMVGGGMLLITLLAFVFGSIYGDVVCRWLLGENFRVISPLLPWALLAGGLFETAQLLSLRLQALMAASQLMWIKGSMASLGVGLNFLSTWHFGVPGLVCSMLIFSILYLTATTAWIVHETLVTRI
jgi:O-antigen/teichoic acid export membrane protein